ncbi:hypothetical protein RVBP21_2900 [Pseudomonas phage BRkr]|nr:hypothetical protein RVBP21_2900 [Pseudomonas phage BRkr]
MATQFEVTLEEIKAELGTPLEIVPMVLHKLFQLPYDLPYPSKILFEEQRLESNKPRLLIRNKDSIVIGIALEPTVDKASILTYIKKAAPTIMDLRPWVERE